MTNLLSPKIKDISKSISFSREPMNLQSVLLWVFLYTQILAFTELNMACLQTLFIKHYSFLFTSLELYSLVLNNWICSYLPRWCHLANVPRKIQFAPVFHYNVYIVSFQNKFYWLFILLIRKLCCLDLVPTDVPYCKLFQLHSDELMQIIFQRWHTEFSSGPNSSC